LRITYNLTGGGVIDTTGFTTGTGHFTAWGHYAPVAAGFSPLGYIKSEEKHVWTTAATTYYDFDLARDYPYRRLMLILDTISGHVRNAFYYTTVNVNQGAVKPLDRFDGDDFVKEVARRFGQFNHTKRYYIANTAAWTTLYTPIRWKQNIAATGGAAFGAPYNNAMDANEFSIMGTGAGAAWVQITPFGFCPHGALMIDLEKISGGLTGPDAMLAAWNARYTDDIDLEIYAKTAAYSCAYVLEQYVG